MQQERDDDEARADLVITESGKVLKNRQGPRSITVMIVKQDGTYTVNENQS